MLFGDVPSLLVSRHKNCHSGMKKMYSGSSIHYETGSCRIFDMKKKSGKEVVAMISGARTCWLNWLTNCYLIYKKIFLQRKTAKKVVQLLSV